MDDRQRQLQTLLENFETAMLVTVDADETMRARPLRIASKAERAELWFLSSRESSGTEDIENDFRAAVTMQGDRRYLSLSGMASVHDDLAKKKELWSATMRPWFPEGVESPDLVAIRFVPVEGEYWDSSGLNGVKYLIEGVTAIVKGGKLQDDDPKRHGTVSL